MCITSPNVPWMRSLSNPENLVSEVFSIDPKIEHHRRRRDVTMTVTVKFFGPVREQAGQETAVFSFPQGATYGHLLDAIGKRFGHRFDKRLWDVEQNLFKAGLSALGAGRDFRGREMLLKEGEEIKIVPRLAGG
jgi:molybdopterin converting factor small subunit